MPRTPFHRRHHYARAKAISVREDAPENLRYFVPKTARNLGCSPHAQREIVCEVLNTRPNPDNWTADPNVWGEVQDLVSRCDWFYVYTIIEDIYEWFTEADEFDPVPDELADDLPVNRAEAYENQINDFFEEQGVGWQLKRGEIITRGNEAFESTVKTSVMVLEQDKKPTAAGHLQNAISALSARPKPDTSGAVAHATSAVECVLGEITGKPMTLGKYLDKYPKLFHPSLKKGLDGIYGYASDEGARHGKEGTEPAREEAEFALAVCAAVCTLLSRKHPGGQ
jgi:hypothetical protein